MQHVEHKSPGNMMSEMMHQCASVSRWMPLFPITIGVTLFLLGYYLEAESVRLIFLTFAAVPVIMGIFGFIMMNSMKK